MKKNVFNLNLNIKPKHTHDVVMFIHLHIKTFIYTWAQIKST